MKIELPVSETLEEMITKDKLLADFAKEAAFRAITSNRQLYAAVWETLELSFETKGVLVLDGETWYFSDEE